MLAVVVLLAAACSGDEQRITGTVVAVEGDLGGVVSFEVQTDRGRLRFEPASDLAGFVNEQGEVDAPLTHLFDHLRDGVPVRVTYRVEDGVNVAIRLEDAP